MRDMGDGTVDRDILSAARGADVVPTFTAGPVRTMDELAAQRRIEELRPEPYQGGLTSSPPGRIVSVCSHGERLFLATEFFVYEMVDGIWHPMVFATGEEPSSIDPPPPEVGGIDRTPSPWWKS